MITLFRKIRQKLIDDGNVRRYLIYAIGEILLVVIGILIALQINNWNEDRKLRSQELEMLHSLKASLENDADDREDSRERNEVARNSMETIINHMEADLPYVDSLKYHFQNIISDWGLQFDYSAYEALKANNINLISNDSLRNSIVDYYSYAEGYGTSLPNRYTNILEEASRNIFIKHFDQMWSSRIVDGIYVQGEMVPIDYEALKEDQEYNYFLKTLRNQNYWLSYRPLNAAEQRSNDILPLLDSEIARLSGN
ncbi:DUF6090 family protein [Rhodohalobacter mucosus]|uniref:Uncharacterized protein n=1 Tax=Rhodohalobacter mucosus TaxID=2079485 RepID=A0A316TLN3_9BACT|nr:DUF6090 family protein [Rhodohalobacter mucosus]PWN05493.1 hypothetical protein DDZ15_12860 [Rhodohalobacter mucosus]